MSVLDLDFFRNEQAAYAQLEAVLWPQGPECPHCGVIDQATKIKANTPKKVRHGLYKCDACKEQFTVTVGSVMHGSHLPLHKWLQAAYLICSSKKGVSAKQIERTIQVTYKSAWFMMHRLRAAMDPIYTAAPQPMGGEGKIIEADETYIGRKAGYTKKAAFHHKNTVFSLVERGGEVRSFHLDRADKQIVKAIVDANVRRETRHYTDGATWYQNNALGLDGGHDWVDHGKEEWVRGDVHTNTVEGFFSVFKRGMKGIYQHCSEKHLHRYLAEFDFRYNNRERLGIDDTKRTENALKGAKGKRLTYRRTREQLDSQATS